MNFLQLLQQRFHGALTALAPDPAPYSALVKPAQDAKFGDYQFNGAMSLAKTLGKKPRDIAQEILQRLPKDDLFEHVEIAGPGFINIRLSTDWLARELQRIAKGGSVVDPALVQELVTARRRKDPLATLSARERQVLALMAEGRSNAGIARRLFVVEGTVEKHISNILTKLNLHEADEDHRRVLAAITFLKAR